MNALLSVSDKTGIVEFAQALHALDIQLISTGGTAKLLADKGLPVTEVAEVTGFPEILDGCVKTLHPKVHGGLLARRDVSDHMAALKSHAIDTIDLAVINLYPFEATVTIASAPRCPRCSRRRPTATSSSCKTCATAKTRIKAPPFTATCIRHLARW